MTITHYEPSMTDARGAGRYFDVNTFGKTGARRRVVDFKLGPTPSSVSQHEGRCASGAVKVHDMPSHSPGYGHTSSANIEISAWEIAPVAKTSFHPPWALNLGGTFLGPRS